jgi:hypothetical protein
VRLSALVAAADGGLLQVSHDGADPLITAVVTTDLLDPSRYLTGGELVLSGLAWWRPRSPARTRAFVQALASARVSALAAGEAGFDGMPDDLVVACQLAGLTLLKVPVDVAFSTITEQAAQHLSARRSDDVAAVLGRHRALVVAATRGLGGLAQVLDLVQADLGLHGWVFSPTGRLIAGEGPEAREGRTLAEHFLRAPSLPHRTVLPGGGPVSLFAAGTARRAASWLLAVPEDYAGWTSQRRAVVDELARIVALARDLVRSDMDDEFGAALAGSTPTEVAALLRRRGCSPEDSLVAVTAHGACAVDVLAEVFAGESGWFGRLAADSWGPGGLGSETQLPAGGAPPVVVWPRETGVHDEAGADAVWPDATVGRARSEGAIGVVRSDDAAAVLDRVRSVVAAVEPGLGGEPLRVGVSDAVTGAAGLVAAVAEANAAAFAASLNPGFGSTFGVGRGPSGAGRHTVAGPDLLVSHSLLLAAVPQQLRDGYRIRVLGALIEHDRRHRSQLLRTLEAYLACSGSWSRCAEMMHVHVNTLRYRIERIEALTGRDLRRLGDQVDLLLALALRP